MMDVHEDGSNLTGQLLVAMPGIGDERFDRTVIYLCAHSGEGAMGLVVNKTMDDINVGKLLSQLDIDISGVDGDAPIHFGGPVESSRGFVLHSADYVRDSTMVINDAMALTATVEVLRAIAGGDGPQKCVLALGYAGWAPGQLDAEIQANGWLIVPAADEIVFGEDNAAKWEQALAAIGITPALLSGEAGHA